MAPAPRTDAETPEMDRFGDGLSFPTASAWRGAACSCVGHGCLQPLLPLGPRQGPPGALSSLGQAGHRAFLSGLTPGQGIAAGETFPGRERIQNGAGQSKLCSGFLLPRRGGDKPQPFPKGLSPYSSPEMGGVIWLIPRSWLLLLPGGMGTSLQHQLRTACAPRRSGPALELPSRCSVDIFTLLAVPPVTSTSAALGLAVDLNHVQRCAGAATSCRGEAGGFGAPSSLLPLAPSSSAPCWEDAISNRVRAWALFCSVRLQQ